MTGKDLIIYILENGLENTSIDESKNFLNFLSIGEAAAKFNVGTATIKAWYEMGVIDGVKIGDTIYISPKAQSPLKTCPYCASIWL